MALPIVSGFLDCFSKRTAIVSIIPLLAMGIGRDNILNLALTIVVFYILSILGGVIIQYWNCNNAKKRTFYENVKKSYEGTWYIPMMFTIFTIVDFVLSLPIFLEIRGITLLLTLFISIPPLFMIVMYAIALQNYCIFSAGACD
jgi:hypothetical protein